MASLSSTTEIELALGGLLVLLTVAAWLAARIRGRVRYRSRETLLTPAEHAFHQTLLQALPPNHQSCLKVRLADILEPYQGKRYRSDLSRIWAKHLDFVIVHIPSSRIVCAIELDDRSHLLPHRRERDEFLDRAMGSASVPLIRVPVAKSYSAAELRRLIEDLPAGKR